MAVGTRKCDRQPTMWVPTTELPTAASHPFYARLNQLLRDSGSMTSPRRGAHRSHTGRIYDRTDPMGIIVRDTSLDIREESIYGLLDHSRIN
jgi:hypothetical protein